MNSLPFISIVTPAFNAADTIHETIQSVERQNYKNYEHIIIDDGSRDGTYELLKKVSKENKQLKVICHHEHVNKGVSASRNLGIRIAQGQWIAFLDSDDITKLGEISYNYNDNGKLSY